MRKTTLALTISVLALSALTSRASSTEQRIEVGDVYAESCVYHSESLDPDQCTTFHVLANFETREFEVGAETGKKKIAFRVDGRSVTPLAFMMPAAFFEGFEGSLRVRRFAEVKDGKVEWQLTDGHCTGDGAGNVTCAAIGGDETVVLKLKGLKS